MEIVEEKLTWRAE